MESVRQNRRLRTFCIQSLFVAETSVANPDVTTGKDSPVAKTTPAAVAPAGMTDDIMKLEHIRISNDEVKSHNVSYPICSITRYILDSNKVHIANTISSDIYHFLFFFV